MLFSQYFLLITKVSLITAAMEPFILDGDYVTIKTFPHSVLLNVNCNDEFWICGASLVNQNILLTAAHCFSDCNKIWDIDAFAGHETIMKMRTKRSVVRFVVHPDYDENIVINDIGLALIKPQFQLGHYVKRVIITKKYNNVKYAKVAGWGMVDERTKEDAVTLMSAKQQIVKPSQCSSLGRLQRGRFCASWIDSRSRPSSGDSGSALITDQGVQIGLVSFRVDRAPSLVAYTNVSYYYKWIMHNSIQLYCKN